MKYSNWSLWLGIVWSLQRPSSKSKPLAMNPHGFSTWMVIVWSLQRPSPKYKPKGTSHFISCPKQPLQFNGQDLVNDSFLLRKRNDSLSTIVWVSIPVWPKLPSRVRRLLQKVIIANYNTLWSFALVWRVERRNSWFLATWLVEINGLLTFGHNVKRP